MVALEVPIGAAQTLELNSANLPEGSDVIPASDMHVTLAYMGKVDEQKGRRGDVAANVARIAAFAPLVRGTLNGVMLFNKEDDGKIPLVVSVDSDHLHTWREQVVEQLSYSGDISHHHGFTPHITLAYIPAESADNFVLPSVSRESVVFDSLLFAWGDEMDRYRLQGEFVKGIFIKAFKSGDDWILDILAAPFGSPDEKDSDGEYFSERTEFYLDKHTPQAIYYHGYDENKRPMGEGAQYLGNTLKTWFDSSGLWIRVALDKTSKYAKKVWEAPRRAASSGSIAHLVRKAQDGEILKWPMPEISVWDWSPDRPQANKRAIALPALKAAGINVPDELVEHCESEERAEERSRQTSGAAGDSSSHIYSSDKELDIMENETTLDEKSSILPGDMMKLVREQVRAEFKAEHEAKQAEEKAKKAQDDAVQAALDKQAEEMNAQYEKALKAYEEEAAKANRLQMGGQAPYQSKFGYTRKFENIEQPEDLAFAVDILRNNRRSMARPSEEAIKTAAIFLTEMADPNPEEELKFLHPKTAVKMAGLPTKADELNRTDLAGFGDEWVSQAWSGALWRRILFETPVVMKIPRITIPQGAESVTIPIEADGIRFYRTPQAADQVSNPGRPTPTVTTDKLPTLNRTITPGKITGATTYSSEITEDSIINWASEIRRMLQQRGQEAMEHLVIDGDTEMAANTNINHIAGTPTAVDIYTNMNGFRKLALVTNTQNSRDAAGLAIEDYLETVKMMGLAGRNARNKAQTSFITDMNTNWATLKLTEMKNRDYMPMGANPTVSGGDLTSVWGYDVIPSGFMHEADVAGAAAGQGLRASATGTINQGVAGTTGSILAVRWDQWRIGYSRMWTVEVDKDIWSDSHAIVMHSRVGMIARDNEAAAISYNVTV